MAPPGIIGRSKGLYPQRPRWQGGLWNGMFPGASGSPTSLGGQAPMQNLGREGISPLFDAPPQSPYRPGKAPGINPMGVGQMAKFDALQGMLGQFQEGREDLRGGRMRQEELRQGQFNTNWQQYAQQAPLMNLYQSPQFGQIAQGLGPGGVPPLSAEEGQYWRGRNAYQGQPGSSQMMDRFGPQSPLTSGAALNAAMFGAQQAGRGVVMQPGGYGSPLEFAPQGQSQADTLQQAEMQQRSGLLDSEGMLNRTYEGPYTRRDRNGDIAYTSREQALRDAGQDSTADQVAAARQAKFDAFRDRRKALGLRTRDDIAGRRADREAERSETMQNRQAQMLSRRGISPLSPEGQSLAPDLYTSIQNRRRGGAVGAGSPLTAPDGTPVEPVSPTAPRSAGTMQQAGKAYQAIANSSPLFKAAGVEYDAQGGGSDPRDAAVQVGDWLFDNNGAASPEDLVALHTYAQQSAASSSEDPYAIGWLTSRGSSIHLDAWKKLAGMKKPTPDDLQKWKDKYMQDLGVWKSVPMQGYF